MYSFKCRFIQSSIVEVFDSKYILSLNHTYSSLVTSKCMIILYMCMKEIHINIKTVGLYE